MNFGFVKSDRKLSTTLKFDVFIMLVCIIRLMKRVFGLVTGNLILHSFMDVLI